MRQVRVDRRHICCKCTNHVSSNQARISCSSCRALFHDRCAYNLYPRHKRKTWKCDQCKSLSTDDVNAGANNIPSNTTTYDIDALNEIFRNDDDNTPVNGYVDNNFTGTFNNADDAYISCDELATYCSEFHLNSSLLTLCVNVRSLGNIDNFTRFQTLIYSLPIKPHLIAVNETWINQKNKGPQSNVEGYTFIHNSRKINEGGGVGLYLLNHLNFTLRNDLNIMNEKTFESIFVDVYIGNRTITVGTIYRSSSQDSNIPDFLNTLGNTLSIITKSPNRACYILGDINLDLAETNNNYVNLYKDCMLNKGFFSLINKPTRITDTTASCIDNIWTNVSDLNIKSGIICAHVADHLPIFQMTAINQCTSNAKKRRRVVITDYDRLENELGQTDLSSIIDENDNNKSFSNLIVLIKDKMRLCSSEKKYNY